LKKQLKEKKLLPSKHHNKKGKNQQNIGNDCKQNDR